jgi:Tfp pilus assembly protein PilZ
MRELSVYGMKIAILFIMNKRIEKRLEKSLLAYLDGDSDALLGVISNISKNGIYIETNTAMELESEISFVLAVYNELYHLKGEVRWIKRPDELSPEDIPPGMGIRITEAPVEYLNYVEYIKYQSRHSLQVSH